ncbi:MAG: AgmX/PglI C-terminal domain-containing protein [Fibrobacter sp.]|nr:AgmX/PglI C-terminal domain-containing protein [Fibrobacter sp.]
MNYKIVMKACKDQAKAKRIAVEISRRSGQTVEQILHIITEKDICIKKEADFDEAITMRNIFRELGAKIELIRAGVCVSGVNNTSGDDEDDIPGRILNDEELLQKVKRNDAVFAIETDHRLRNFEMVSMVLAIGCGIFLSTREIITEVKNDFLESIEPSVNMTTIIVDRPQAPPVPQREIVKERQVTIDKKSLKKTVDRGTGNSGGGGDPKERITKKGILGIINGRMNGKSVADAEIFSKGGFTTDIDAILQGVGGLKNMGNGGVGRKGAAGMGFGTGYNSGFGSGTSIGVDDIFSKASSYEISLKTPQRAISANLDIDIGKGSALIGGRNKSSVMRVVMQNINALRYAYNKRLRERPGLKGKVTVKFAIDEFGKVLYCQVVESSINDQELESVITDKVGKWVFDKIDKPGDITEVVYPFMFSQ